MPPSGWVYAPYALSSFCDTGWWPTATSPTGRIFWSAPSVCRVGHRKSSSKMRVSSASTRYLLLPSRDRLLLALKRGYPEHFAAVFELKCSPREAGIRAGIIKTRRFRCGGVWDSPESLPSGPAHEPQSQSGHENGYNDTTPPEPSLSGVSDYEVHTLRRGRRSFEPAQTCCRILITDLMSRQSTRRT